MDKKQFVLETKAILAKETDIDSLAQKLEELWLKAEKKTTGLIKEELQEKLKVVGTDVNILKAIGQTVGKEAKKEIDNYVLLSEILWNKYGLEGRVVAAHILSFLNEKEPDKIISVCYNLLQSCISWGECDNMTYGVEPVIRKKPKENLDRLIPWLTDENKWIKRAALNVLARLPMKQPSFTRQALDMIIPCLDYEDNDVRRTCSFAIRMSARGNIKSTYKFIEENVGGENANKIWIFCDAMRSMTKQFLPEFKPLLPLYKKWLDEIQNPKSGKSIKAAIKLLEKI